MATAFRSKSGRIVGRLDTDEIEILVHLLRSTRDLVAPEQDETGDPLLDLIGGLPDEGSSPSQPEDPALLRLLPVAHRTDPDQANEFRALTEHSLRRRKASNLNAAMEALMSQGPGRIELDQTQASALMVALTDVRLVLGERLGLRSDEDSADLHRALLAVSSSPGKDEPGLDEVSQARLQQMAYYDFLSWLQESITIALLKD